FQKPKIESVHQSHCSGFNSYNPRFQRVEIWIHPMDGQTTVIQGGRRLLIHSNTKLLINDNTNNHSHTIQNNNNYIQGKSMPKLNSSTVVDYEIDNEDEDDEEAQAEAEEYANISLIE
ncbi:unnamed protein product, partial [Schistosoma turkestanicum]